MRPKEIQEKLGINADKIKLFKREGIFSPENPPCGNRSTDYTETDFENLRLIVVLTKSGLTCSDIRKLQDGKCTLEKIIINRSENIQAEISRKRNSLALICMSINKYPLFVRFTVHTVVKDMKSIWKITYMVKAVMRGKMVWVQI